MRATGHARSYGRRITNHVLAPIRRHHYTRRALPVPQVLLAPLGLDDQEAIGSRRLDLGCGPFPQPGYIHVDITGDARHLEAIAPGWDLPFPDDWAREIVSIHSLEHYSPSRLAPTLSEWYRVLQPGGTVRIHVPNAPALLQAFGRVPLEEKWPVMGGILGMYCSPEARDANGVGASRGDHQILFDWPLMSWALDRAGFIGIEDKTGLVTDRHREPWRELVGEISLVACARKPG